jgi:hypothetical protein
VVKTTETLGLLLALGMCAFISNASAELPKPGEYKGTLTIIKTMKDRSLAEGPPVIVKTVVRASARVDAEGYIRVVFADDRDPILGVFSENESLFLLSVSSEVPVSIDTRTIVFETPSISREFLTGALDTVPFTIEFTTKLKRVGK